MTLRPKKSMYVCMKTVLAFLFIATILCARADNGSINDSVLPVNSPAPGGNADLQAKINVLQADIAQKRRAITHEGAPGTDGAYREIIVQDQAQIKVLRAQMPK